ncbi:putative MFS-type transporter [Fusarium oxysporum f. sp. conglutinans]|nr:putative MFS-type transporter [Fusarium oxysporum f. sp. conglutinans]
MSLWQPSLDQRMSRQAWRCLEYLGWPVICFAGFSYGSYLIWFNVTNATASIILSGSGYNFKPSMVGLSYLSCCFGTVVGSLVSGRMSDWLTIKLARRNNGVMEAEHRLWPLMICVVLVPTSLILWGVGAQQGVHWFFLILAMGALAAACAIGLTISINYLIDCYHGLAGNAIVSIILIRNTMSFCHQLWYHSMGYQYGLSELLYLSRAYWTGYVFCLLRHDQIWKALRCRSARRTPSESLGPAQSSTPSSASTQTNVPNDKPSPSRLSDERGAPDASQCPFPIDWDKIRYNRKPVPSIRYRQPHKRAINSKSQPSAIYRHGAQLTTDGNNKFWLCKYCHSSGHHDAALFASESTTSINYRLKQQHRLEEFGYKAVGSDPFSIAKRTASLTPYLGSRRAVFNDLKFKDDFTDWVIDLDLTFRQATHQRTNEIFINYLEDIEQDPSQKPVYSSSWVKEKWLGDRETRLAKGKAPIPPKARSISRWMHGHLKKEQTILPLSLTS